MIDEYEAKHLNDLDCLLLKFSKERGLDFKTTLGCLMLVVTTQTVFQLENKAEKDCVKDLKLAEELLHSLVVECIRQLSGKREEEEK